MEFTMVDNLQLAKKFAPRVQLYSSDSARPSSIEFMLRASELKHRSEGTFSVTSPTIGQLTTQFVDGQASGSRTPQLTDFYLDVLDDNALLGEPIVNNQCTSPCYARVTTNGDDALIQYWFFYPDNPALGDATWIGFGGHHVGDWEHIRVYVPNFADADAHLVWAYYDAHGRDMGRRYQRNQLTRVEGEHPVVYSANKSHASYNTAGTHVRYFHGIDSLMPDDHTDGTGPVWNTWNNLVLLGPLDVPAPHWIQYNGRWGSTQESLAGAGDGNSPQGPAMRSTYNKLPTHGIGLHDKGAVISKTPYGPWESSGNRVRASDVKGHGRLDFLIGPDAGGTWYWIENLETGFADRGAFINSRYGDWGSSPERINELDLTGQGFNDILIGPDEGGNWYVLQNTGDGFIDRGAVIQGSPYGVWASATGRIRYVDLTGNGFIDVLLGPDSSGIWYVIENKGNLLFADHGGIIHSPYGDWQSSADRIRLVPTNAQLPMFNILIGPDEAGKWYLIENKGNLLFADQGVVIKSSYGDWQSSANRIRNVAMLGSILPDIVLGPDDSGKWYLIQNNGNKIFTDHGMLINLPHYGKWDSSAPRINYFDITRNRHNDIVLGPDENGEWFVIENEPPTTPGGLPTFQDCGAVISTPYGSWQNARDRTHYADFDGDGTFDISLGPDAAGNWYMISNNP